MAMVGLQMLNGRYSTDILLYVYRHEGCIKTELYSGLGSKARLPEKIRKLDDAGLLRQDVDRSTHLYTTDKGRMVASKLAEIEGILEGIGD